MARRRKDDIEQETAPSRTALKQAAKNIEHLARQVVELPAAALNRLDVDDDLRREIDLARATKGHGARDRQIRHLAAVLRRRDDESEALQTFVDDLEGGQRQDAELFHRLEELRDRLCNPTLFSTALAEAESAWPHLDTGALERLAHSVHATGDKKAFREIFRMLRTASQTQS